MATMRPAIPMTGWHLGGTPSEYGTPNANTVFGPPMEYEKFETGIATVYGIPMNTTLEEVPPEYAPGLAVGRLIAAAPDLKAAAKAALETLTERHYYDSWGNSLDTDLSGLVEMLEQAIAKSEGK